MKITSLQEENVTCCCAAYMFVLRNCKEKDDLLKTAYIYPASQEILVVGLLKRIGSFKCGYLCPNVFTPAIVLVGLTVARSDCFPVTDRILTFSIRFV